MKPIRNPIYLTLALAMLLYVAMANRHGWSLAQTLVSRTWQHSNPATQHK